jgi:putative peptidoglycan lipid II flippase
VTISVATVLFNAALNYSMVRVFGFGYTGLALGTSVAALFNATLLLIFLHRHLSGLDGRRIVTALVKILVASLLMGAAALATDAALARFLPGDAIALQIVRLGAAIGVALVVLATAAHVLHIREFRQGMSLVTRRLSRRR